MYVKIGRRRYRPSEIRKALVALTGAVGILATQAVAHFTPWLSPEIASEISSFAGFVTTVGVFLVRNAAPIDLLDNLVDEEPGETT